MTLPNKAIDKQAYEAFFIGGSILKVQTDTETINLANSTVVAEDVNGTDVSSSFLEQATIILGNDSQGTYANNQLSMRIRDGEESLSPYKVTFRMETTEGNKWEVDRMVNVIET